MTGYSGFAGPVPVPGYCLRVNGDGSWALLAGAAPAALANGTLPAPFSANASHALSLSTVGPVVSASVDGATLANVSSSAYVAGMVALGSGYHPAAFDNFALEAAGMQ